MKHEEKSAGPQCPDPCDCVCHTQDGDGAGLVGSFEYRHKPKCPRGLDCNCGLTKLLARLNTNYEPAPAPIEPAKGPATPGEPHWNVLNREREKELEAILHEAVYESGCDGDLCTHAWHEKATRILGDKRWERPASREPQGDVGALQVEMTLLRGRLNTIHLAGTFGETNQRVVKRIQQLEWTDDQARQYIQHAQEREHRINELEARLAAQELATPPQQGVADLILQVRLEELLFTLDLIRHRSTLAMRTEIERRIASVRKQQAESQPSPTPVQQAGDAYEPSEQPWPDCKEFYDLMQFYRHAPVTDQAFVHERYELVMKWLRATRIVRPKLLHAEAWE